jgi:heptose I phosphotransferase
MKMWLREDFNRAWQGQDPFSCVDKLDGKVYRALEGRRTLRFELHGDSFFLKSHKGIGWGEVFKNLLQLKLPILGADAEYHAIKKLEQLGVDTMTPAAYGERGWNPAKQESFIITEDLKGSVSLEDYCKQWTESPPTLAIKRALITKIAQISAQLHNNGVNHRDYYLCHFHLFPDTLSTDVEKIKLHVIDLHRTQLRRKVPLRWLIKDLGSLYYSALDFDFTRNDVLRFLKAYFQKPLKSILKDDVKLLQSVEVRAVKIYSRDFGKAPKLPF